MFDAVIVGGGIIGHSISYHLNKSGIHSAVIEKGQSGKKATRAAAGMLGVHTENEAPDLFHHFCLMSRNIYTSLSEELLELTGIDIGLSSFGMYQGALTAQQKEKLLVKEASFSNLKWLEGEQLKSRIPWLTESVIGALYMGEDGHVEPSHVCEAFKRGALLHGGELFEDSTVLDIEQSKDSFNIQIENEILKAGKVIIASGSESGRWFEKTGMQNPIVPTKGECFSVDDGRIGLKETLFFENFYAVPKRDGRLIIGATSKSFDSSAAVTAGGISSLMNNVFAVLPELTEAPLLDYWSGIRPGTVDGRPIIGEHPYLSGIYFATGHYRNGILLAPATGQLMRDIIKEGNNNVYGDLLSPGRLLRKGENMYEPSS
ncbi:glycine oxidase ThiO [Halobacillus massiliensis]|uniref:glycine oxidase ThiO n=1 Tax=Halobacillus massiliensis TaxID=1926286 RepID=UPI0009E65178|nr:glycine oxidase ThiO [Halobacillus massiliensis]